MLGGSYFISTEYFVLPWWIRAILLSPVNTMLEGPTFIHTLNSFLGLLGAFTQVPACFSFHQTVSVLDVTATSLNRDIWSEFYLQQCLWETYVFLCQMVTLEVT